MGRLAVLRLVMGNRRLRRVVLAFAGFNFADWARWLAILLYAFERGGAVEAGAISMLQLLPATVVARDRGSHQRPACRRRYGCGRLWTT